MENYRKLQRNTHNKVLGGVCSGLADYLGIDTALVRILFAIFLFAGAGLFIYLILWIVMPARRDYQNQQAEGQYAAQKDTGKSSRSSFTAGLVLIIMGVVLLLGDLIPQVNWKAYWPVLLIILGLSLIVPLSKKDKQ